MIDETRTHGGKRAGAGRKRKDVEVERKKKRFQQPEQAATYAGLETPLDYMLAVMRDPLADFERRDARYSRSPARGPCGCSSGCDCRM
jgi:hypothetical protein